MSTSELESIKSENIMLIYLKQLVFIEEIYF